MSLIKLTTLSVIIFMGLFLSNPLVAQMQGFMCAYEDREIIQEELEEEWDCLDEQEGVFQLELPGYPDCEITYFIRYNICYEPYPDKIVLIQIYYMTFAISLDEECEDLMDELYDGTDINIALIKEIEMEGFRKYTNDEFNDFYHNLPPFLQNHYKCSVTGSVCDEPDTDDLDPLGALFRYYFGSCSSPCVYYIFSEGPSPTPIAIGYKMNYCASQCCKVSRKHCFCEATQTVLVTETIEPAGTVIDCDLLPVPTCVNQVPNFPSYPCSLQCEEE